LSKRAGKIGEYCVQVGQSMGQCLYADVIEPISTADGLPEHDICIECAMSFDQDFALDPNNKICRAN
jgi:hypothetical protein